MKRGSLLLTYPAWVLSILLMASTAAPGWGGSDQPPSSIADDPAEETVSAESHGETGEDPAGDSAEEAPREIRPRAIVVKGCGFWTNRMLKKVVWLLLPPEGSRPSVLESDFIEDAVSMMYAELQERGYLQPSMTLQLELVSGEIQHYRWNWEALLTLPRPLEVRKVIFRVERGVRYHYSSIRFEGLQAMPEGQAESYFRGVEFLIRQKSTRIYSPTALNSSIGHLEDAIRLLGYADVWIEVATLDRNDTTGAVNLTLVVHEGPIHRVRAAIEQVRPEETGKPIEVRPNFPFAPFSEYWVEDWHQEMRRRQYREGYADARVTVGEVRRVAEGPEDDPDRVFVDLAAVTEPGSKLLLGEVRFTGQRKTREGFLSSRSRLRTGELLNPLRVQEARYRLTRTGLFNSVRFRYEESELETDPPSRDVEFQLQEAKSTQVSLLAGYGSYELLRGGIEWEQRNLFGVGHNSRLRLVQAVRATRAEYDYSVPGLFNTPADGFLGLYAKQRDEPEFRRRDVGGSIGVERPVAFLRSRVGIRYTYEYLDARGTGAIDEFGTLAVRAASVAVHFVHDRRDNSLSPERGHHLFARGEVASESLGGEANYQLVEAGGSYHLPFPGGRYVHLGVSHGIVRPQGDRSLNLPFNKRFFPGGENSIRGYRITQASPRDELGNLVGAESYWMTNVELEQALTAAWSVVLFNDTVGLAADIDDYPSTEILTSIGLGIRWKTPVGPVRFEYGHNLNPRSKDPSGTFLFSIGFPF
jgi:outer membrane protein insertion porin family